MIIVYQLLPCHFSYVTLPVYVIMNFDNLQIKEQSVTDLKERRKQSGANVNMLFGATRLTAL